MQFRHRARPSILRSIPRSQPRRGADYARANLAIEEMLITSRTAATSTFERGFSHGYWTNGMFAASS
jgi:hypothetical protein